MSDKKASDYLISIEAKLDRLIAEYDNSKFQTNLLLNKLHKLIGNNTPIVESKDVTLTDASDFVFTQVEDVRTNTNVQQKQSIPGLKSNVEMRDGVLIQVGDNNDTFHPTLLLKPVPVSQRILYPDGSGVFNAKINIFDSNKNKIKTIQTNNGKWNSALMPGNYTILITKPSTNIKPEINFTVHAMIPNSDTVIELPTQQDIGGHK